MQTSESNSFNSAELLQKTFEKNKGESNTAYCERLALEIDKAIKDNGIKRKIYADFLKSKNVKTTLKYPCVSPKTIDRLLKGENTSKITNFVLDLFFSVDGNFKETPEQEKIKTLGLDEFCYCVYFLNSNMHGFLEKSIMRIDENGNVSNEVSSGIVFYGKINVLPNDSFYDVVFDTINIIRPYKATMTFQIGHLHMCDVRHFYAFYKGYNARRELILSQNLIIPVLKSDTLFPERIEINSPEYKRLTERISVLRKFIERENLILTLPLPNSFPSER